MNPDSPKTPQEEMEARLIALLLGELSDQEAAAWHAAIATNPELAKLHDRLKQTISLVREATAKVTEPVSEQTTPLKLSEERREKLLAHFKTVKPKEFAPVKRRVASWLVPLAATAVLVLLLSAITIPNFVRSRNTSQANAVINNLRQLDSAKQQWALEKGKSDNDVPTFDDIKNYMKGELPPAVAGETYALGKVGEPVTAEVDAKVANRRLGRQPVGQVTQISGDQRVRLSSDDTTDLVLGRADQVAKAEDPSMGFRTWGTDRAASPSEQAPTRALFDSISSPASKPDSTQQERKPTVHFANTPAPKPEEAKPNATPPPQIVLPPQVEVLGAPEVAKIADRQDLGRGSLSLGVRGESEERKGVTTSAADESQQRMFYERYGIPAQQDRKVVTPASPPAEVGLAENRVQISGQADLFYSDLNRSPAPTLAPPPAGAAMAINGVARPALAGRGISPTTGMPLESVSPDEAALGQTITVTRADRGTTRSYAVEPAIRESGVHSGGTGGGAGATYHGGAFVAPQTTPGQAAAGDVVTGYAIAPTPALLPAEPQEAVPPIVALTTESDADKIPVLGDLPTVGKLFRGEAERGQALKLPTGGKPDSGLVTQTFDVEPNLFKQGLGSVSGPSPANQPLGAGITGGTSLGATPQPLESKLKLADTGKDGVQTEWYAGNVLARNRALSEQAGTPPTAATEESLRRKRSSIVLPSLETARRIPSDGDADQLALAKKDKVEAATQVQDGRILLEAGRLDDAEVKLKEAIKQDPENRAAFYYLSLAKERRYLEAEAKREQDSKQSIVQVEHAWERPPQSAQGRTESLKDQLAALEPEVRAAQKKVNELRAQFAITDLDAMGITPAPMIEAETVRQLHAQLIDAEAKLGKPASEQRHGELQAKVDMLKGQMEQARATDIARAESSRPYYDARTELDEALRLRSALNIKLIAEGIDLSLPKSAMVEILDRAQPAAEKTGFWRSLGAPIGGTYQSAARVRIERDRSDIQGFTERAPFGNAYDPYFIQTEFEVIQSEAVLAQAVDKLNLDKKWAKTPGENLKKDEAVAMLKQRLELKPVRNTSVLEVRAKSDKPDEAAAIANAVAEAYTDYRREKGRKLTSGGIEALKQQSEAQEKKVAQAQRELERVARESGVELADLAIRKPATNAPIAQPEIQASENAFSTFSLNVSDVSFKLAAASLEKGQMPDQASIRSEEFINAFDYRDPEPLPGVPVAFAWERARYPFAHNRDLLRFSLKTGAVGRQAGRPLNLVLLLDNSGSMERADRVHIIREALRVLAGQLQPQDKLSVITFARTPRLWVDGASGIQAGEVADQVGSLTPQGGTNLEEAMNLAYQTALRHYLATGINRVVLLTDGAANLGNVEPESLKEKVEAHRKQGIALDCFGIGWEGFNDDLLEVLSRNGDGRYGFINSPEEAATEFAGQLAGALQVAASDVKVQVEFNPARVTAYRQIGYAKHQLTKEQFRDNTVDAAEIAAQEAGNALYTVEVNPAGEGPLAIVRVRFKIPGTSDYREHEWAVPYTGSAVSLEQASPAMRLAASASAFSEWLVASPFAAEVTPDALLGYLSGVPEIYGADARPKKLEWMIRQAKSIEGK